MDIWQVLLKQNAKTRGIMSSIELLGRRVKIFGMLKLLMTHIEYLPQADKIEIKDLIVSELKQKVMKAKGAA